LSSTLASASVNVWQNTLTDEQQTIAVGSALAQAVHQINQGIVVYLHGELGAGKTTLTRGFVRGFGHQGNVKSPTYTLVEPYELAPWTIYHFDLYRLSDPEELEFMGIRDYFNTQSCCFVEWPEKGAGLLPEPDAVLQLDYQGEKRRITITPKTTKGLQLLTAFITLYST
jgi:tRNA threonylcarbamoyladenosine biosynthesis protein TsaE